MEIHAYLLFRLSLHSRELFNGTLAPSAVPITERQEFVFLECFPLSSHEKKIQVNLM